MRLILAVGNFVLTGDGSIAGAGGGAALRGGMVVEKGVSVDVEGPDRPAPSGGG